MVGNCNNMEPKNVKKEGGKRGKGFYIEDAEQVQVIPYSDHGAAAGAKFMIPLPPSPHFYTLFTLLYTLLHTFTHSYTLFHTLPPPTLHFPYPSYHRVKPLLHVKVDEHCMQNHTKQHMHFYTLLINTTAKKNTGNRYTKCLSAFPVPTLLSPSLRENITLFPILVLALS